MQEQESREAHRKFIHSEGDHLTLLNVYRSFKGSGGSKVRCIAEMEIFVRETRRAVNKWKMFHQINVLLDCKELSFFDYRMDKPKISL